MHKRLTAFSALILLLLSVFSVHSEIVTVTAGDLNSSLTPASGDIVCFTANGADRTFLLNSLFKITVSPDETVTWQIGATAAEGEFIIQPKTAATNPLIHLDTGLGGTLIVDMRNDLTIKAANSLAVRFLLTGQGTVVFKLRSGENFTLEGTDTLAASLLIAMDATHDTILVNKKNSVVFSKAHYRVDELVDPTEDLTKHSYVTLGKNAAINFVSQDLATNSPYSYGAIAFDPSNISTGRLILEIARGNAANDFLDGAINISGVYVPDYSASAVVEFRRRAGVRAVMRVIDTLAHEWYQTDSENYPENWVAARGQVTARRGLAVINNCNTIPHLASNYQQLPIQDANYTTKNRFWTNNCPQPGFVVGNNGQLDIEHNRFLDYIAGSINIEIKGHDTEKAQVTAAAVGENGSHTSEMVKKHNPSALYIDGFDQDYWDAIAAYQYLGAETAEINLWGNAALFVHCGAESDNAAINSSRKITALAKHDDAPSGSETISLLNCTIGNGHFDGLTVPLIDAAGNNLAMVSDEPEGEHVLDFEGKCAVIGWDSIFAHEDLDDGKHTIAVTAAINVPSVLIDHAGRETVIRASDSKFMPLARPFPIGTTYTIPRYNISSILLNDTLSLESVRIVHNDLTRDTSYLPTATSYDSPAIVGGELPMLKITKLLEDGATHSQIYDYSGAALRLHNATIECHESLAVAGIRILIHDHKMTDNELNDSDWDAADNTSKIIFYDRGDVLDNDRLGRGRVLQLGSVGNRMANGKTQDLYWVYPDNSVALDANDISTGVPEVAPSNQAFRPVSSLRDCFIDVFRQWSLPSGYTDANPTRVMDIKLSLQTDQEAGVLPHEKSIHVINLAHLSRCNLGWRTTKGHPGFSPFTFQQYLIDNESTHLTLPGLTTEQKNYLLDPYTQGGGVLEMAGDDLFVTATGKYNSNGVLRPLNNEAPSDLADIGGIVYTDLGGKFTTTGVYDTHLATLVARKLSKDGTQSGVVSFPVDQLIYHDGARVVASGLDFTDGHVIQPNGSYNGHILLNNGSNENFSEGMINLADITHDEDTFGPVKSFGDAPRPWVTQDGFGSVSIRNIINKDELFGFTSLPTRGGLSPLTRATSSVTAPVTLPTTGLLVMTTGDSLEQLKIAAATRANPVHLWISGDNTGFARVREFVSVKSDPPVLGEGPYAALFVDQGARIGLGTRRWNADSLHAWNILGQDRVSIFAHGDAIVDVNSDLLLIDKLPIVATTNFGSLSDHTHRLEFYSPVPREIRVPAGQELDLSSFGQGGQARRQQISFGGKVRLVLEPGARIRFPNLSEADRDNAPILYFNDESELIFVGNDDRTEGRWDGSTANGSNLVRCKLLGVGQIWLNKNAKMKVEGQALVGIEADKDTPRTDIVVSLNRQSQFLIGNENVAGGAFQIGNMFDGGGHGKAPDNAPLNTLNSEEGKTPSVETAVNFTLASISPDSLFEIHREGFFGLAAGVVNKFENPNGSTPTTIDVIKDSLTENPTQYTSLTAAADQYSAWRVQALHNVKNITINFDKGLFKHNNIADGWSPQASLMAVGPVGLTQWVDKFVVNDGLKLKEHTGTHTLRLGAEQVSYVHGGGNLMYVNSDATYLSPRVVNIASTKRDHSLLEFQSGDVTLLAPDVLLRTYTNDFGTVTIETSESNPFKFITQPIATGAASLTQTGEALLLKLKALRDLSGALLYYKLSKSNYVTYPKKVIAAGKGEFNTIGGYISGTTMKRQIVSAAVDRVGTPVAPRDALQKGYFIGGAEDALGEPAAYIVP